MKNNNSIFIVNQSFNRILHASGTKFIWLVLTAFCILAFTPFAASAQIFSVPVRWCIVADDANGNGRVDPGEQGAPAFTNPGGVGEIDVDNVLWRRHERPSDNIFIPEAQITFRSGIYNIVEDAMLRFPIIPDPDPNPTGDAFWQYGDLLDSSPGTSAEMETAYTACVDAWRNQHGVEDIGVVVINANHIRDITGDSGPGVATINGRRVWLRDNAYLLPGSPLFGMFETPVDPALNGDHVDKHFAHEVGHALAGLRHTCSNQNLMSQRRFDPSGDGLVDNIHLSTSIAQVIDAGANGRECSASNDTTVNPEADDTTVTVNQIQALRTAAQAAPGCMIAGTNTPCTRFSDIRADRIKDAALSFTDIATFTATNEGAVTKLIHEPLGPLNRGNFNRRDYYDYYSFIDQDQNTGTGGTAEDLGVKIRFKGAELATRVRVRLVGKRFTFTPTVWRFTGGSFVEVKDRRIRAFAFALRTVSERGYGHLSDQITLQMPTRIFGAGINDFKVQAAVVSYPYKKQTVLDLLDEGEQPGRDFRWRSPKFPVCSVTPAASAPRGGNIVVASKGLLPNRPVHLIFGDRHIANGNAAADGSVTISTAVPADARDGRHLITVGTDTTALTADCVMTVKGGEQPTKRPNLLRN